MTANSIAPAMPPAGEAGDDLAVVHAYHQRTKHHLDRYAAGPGSLDWDAQPDPFRRWGHTRFFLLPRHAEALTTRWNALADSRPPAELNLENLGTLLQLSTAITAWKKYGNATWALRAHPSSGNLHPTETWVIASWVDGLPDGLYHYQAQRHSLEWRAGNGPAPGHPGLWLGFSSIHWREAWKYGERAFRYCQLDMGHVLAAISHAAALLGWKPALLSMDSSEVSAALGLDRAEDFSGVEAEEPEIILALHRPEAPPKAWEEWSGVPSLLDPKPMYRWPVIEEVAQATRGAAPVYDGVSVESESIAIRLGDLDAASVILKRRSAQAFDGQSVMPLEIFRRILRALLPGGSPVWAMWPHAPRVHPVVLAHRVEGINPGLYCMPRDAVSAEALKSAMRKEFEWASADTGLPLYRLMAARAANTARTVSCHQDIASMSAFTLMFVAEFEAPVMENPAAYRHLHWEAGMLGHCVSLEAEAAGWRGTGIGCFFDDADHEILGLSDARYQVIYHFAVGMAVEDTRLTTLPAYE